MKKFAISSILAIPMIFTAACGHPEDSGVSEVSNWNNGILIRSAAGEDAGKIQWAVEAFRKDLGDPNNGNGPAAASGRREINWDGVPAAISSPNNFPGDTFRGRGLLISTPGGQLQVSTSNAEAGQAAPLFGNLNRNFPDLFRTFSPEKLFSPKSSNETILTFVVPGTDKKATVAGFGAVFTDVDLAKISKIEYYDLHNKLLLSESVQNVQWKNKSLSFLGASFKDKRIATVKIISGNIPLGAWQLESNWKDAVALDDFLYSEPKAVAQW